MALVPRHAQSHCELGLARLNGGEMARANADLEAARDLEAVPFYEKSIVKFSRTRQVFWVGLLGEASPLPGPFRIGGSDRWCSCCCLGVYGVAVVPLAFLMRLFGKRPLDVSRSGSSWVQSKRYGSLRDPF